MLPYGRQHIINDIRAVTKAPKTLTGAFGEKFERKITETTGAKQAIAVYGGTAALHLACLGVGLEKGDVAIVPTLSFLATANAVRYCGAEVFFADVCSDTGLITPETYETALIKAKKRGLGVKAVLPVHLTGTTVDLKGIKEISKKNKIKIIADSCHALGGKYNGKPVGSCIYEDLSTFSFHPIKTVTSGEGGAITTNNLKLSKKLKALRSHSMEKTKSMLPWQYKMKDLGFNYRINDFQCALGVSQLNRLKSFVKKRQLLASHYDSRLSDCYPIIETRRHTFNKKEIGLHLYSILIDFKCLKIKRENLVKKMLMKGISTQVHYIPIHRQPYYKNRYGAFELKGAKKYYEKTLSLPLFPEMEQKDVDFVVRSLKSVLGI